MITEFAGADVDERNSRTSVFSLLLCNDLSFIMVNETQYTVALYDFDDLSRKPTIWDFKSRHITRIRLLTEIIMAVFTYSGAELHSLRYDALDGGAAVSRTSHKRVALVAIIYSEIHEVLDIWYDRNEARCAKMVAVHYSTGSSRSTSSTSQYLKKRLKMLRISLFCR